MKILLPATLALAAGAASAQENSGSFNAADSRYSVYSSLESFSLSEPQPIHETIKDWDAPFKGGNLAETYNRFEMGFRWNNLSLGYIARYDYRLRFSRDTALFYYQQKNKAKPDSNRLYDIDLDALHQRSQGIVLHYDWQPVSQLSVRGSVSLLQASALTDGRLRGQAGYAEGGRYSGQLNLDYMYTDDMIFSRPLKGDFDGNGYTLDLALEYQPTENTRLHARTRDLIGRIYWDEAPRTVAQARAAERQTEDPFEYYKRAAINGVESYKDFVQHLPQRFELGGSYARGSWRYSLETYIHPDQVYVFPRITRFHESWEFSIQGEPHLKALGFQVANPYFSLELLSDSLSYRDAHFLKLALGARITF